MQIKCTSAHSNISVYCGFKELPVKTANKHCVLHNAVSYLNKGLPSSFLGRENNNTYYTCSDFYKKYFAKEESYFAQIHKSTKGMLLQYSWCCTSERC